MNNETIDILKIDEKIRSEILDEEKAKEYLQIKKKLQDEISTNTLLPDYVSILNCELEKINKLLSEQENIMGFYIADTIDIIEKYKIFLKIPKQLNFMGKVINDDTDEQASLIKKFTEIASKYTFVETNNKEDGLTCSNCSNQIIKENNEEQTYICKSCFVEQNIQNLSISYNDTSRVNISSRYLYDRKTHFRESIMQYQGKQSVIIPENLYKLLDKKFKFHNLLVGNETTQREIRYSKITKKTILVFLKELGYSKHYENINLIFSEITGNKLNDISHIIPQILNDFDVLVEQYDKTYADINRKNFINTQYVLFQLLSKHGYPCEKEDFTNIKTIDRKFFHDDIMKTLFEQLGWNYISIF